MRKQANQIINVATLAFAIFATSAILSGAARAGSSSAGIDKDTLLQVESIYGLNEDQAILRLAKEQEAAEQDRSIRSMNLKSYAGSWFDSETLSLHVAISDPVDSDAIQWLGATPVIVAHNLNDLESVRKQAIADLNNSLVAGSIRKSYIDVKSNQAVVGIASGDIGQAAAVLRSSGLDSQLVRVTQSSTADFSTGNVRGANGTQNLTWNQQFSPDKHPCSIGASVVGGYATAAHCGEVPNQIGTSTEESLGTVEGSTFHQAAYTFDYNEDGAWVDTVSGWTPTPQVNGYSDGTIYVDGEWSGTLEASVGATVCRYGQTSGGPHCAAVTAKDEDVYFAAGSGSVLIKGLTEVDGICTDDGDSGGPIITPAAQMQGTDSGGTSNSCPDSSGDYVYFQPIETTLSRFGVTMLTTHGSSVPTINQYLCPNPGDSGSNHYGCYFDSYDSQGETSISWTTNTNKSSSSTILFSSCNPGQTVVVNLAVTNPYGTSHKSSSFACPSGPLH